MNIGFFLEEMNFRGVVNSTYNYALYNKTILKNIKPNLTFLLKNVECDHQLNIWLAHHHVNAIFLYLLIMMNKLLE